MADPLHVTPLLEEIEAVSESAKDIEKIIQLNDKVNLNFEQVIRALNIEKINYQ